MDVRCVKRCLLVVFTVSLIATLYNPVYAWRPQGRFGKRVSQAHLAQEGDVLRGYGALSGDDSLLVDPEVEMFRSGEIVCLRKGSDAMYRCLRYTGGPAE